MRPPPLVVPTAILAACAGLMLALPAPASPEEATAAADTVRLIPMDPRGTTGPNPHCTTEACLALLGLIEGAQDSVDFAIYGLRGQNAILEALVSARERGVRVRGVVDMDVNNENYYRDTPRLIERLGDVRTDYETDRRKAATQRPYDPAIDDRCERPEGFAGPLQCVRYDLGDRCLFSEQASIEEIHFIGDLMHHKFFVVDNRHVWTGSANISNTDLGGYSANMVVQLDSPVIAGWYRDEFEQMYVQGRFHEQKRARDRQAVTMADGTKVEVFFTPQDRPMQQVRRAIQAAEERIDVAIFFLTHREVSRDLIDAHNRGVRVRVILDATAATNGYTKHPLLRVAGIPVKVEDWGGKMHAKSAAIDGRLVIAGSMNWTSAGASPNDENTVFLHGGPHAAQWTAWFDALWDDIDDRWLLDDPAPESWDSGTACTDGIDNDHDRLIDDEDPGCSDNPPPPIPLPPFRVVPKGDGHDLVKGVIGPYGERWYYTPDQREYRRLQVNEARGDRWFCSTFDATSLGWERGGRGRRR